MKQGNVLIIAMVFVAICILILVFISAIIMSQVNSLLYSLKIEMFEINRSAIIAVNKNETSIQNFTYNSKAYKEYFKKALMQNFNLNSELKNENGLIESINIEEYDIIEKKEKDPFTRNKLDNRVIHTVIDVKVKPIIMRDILSKVFTFKIHEDVNLKLAYES